MPAIKPMMTMTIMTSISEKATERLSDEATKGKACALCIFFPFVASSLNRFVASSLNRISRLQNRQHGRENDDQHHQRQDDDQQRFEDGDQSLGGCRDLLIVTG